MEVIKVDPRITFEKATVGSAGYDLQAGIESTVVIRPGETVMIPLGFKMHIENANFAALLLPRSGLGKKGIVLANTIGLIDSDYQGEVKAALKNTGNDVFEVTPLMRVCQLIFIPVFGAEFEYVESFSDASVRGEGGFGSTGTQG